MNDAQKVSHSLCFGSLIAMPLVLLKVPFVCPWGVIIKSLNLGMFLQVLGLSSLILDHKKHLITRTTKKNTLAHIQGQFLNVLVVFRRLNLRLFKLTFKATIHNFNTLLAYEFGDNLQLFLFCFEGCYIFTNPEGDKDLEYVPTTKRTQTTETQANCNQPTKVHTDVVTSSQSDKEDTLTSKWKPLLLLLRQSLLLGMLQNPIRFK